VLTCQPASPSEEEPCARSIINTLARKAFRRPPTDEDVDTLLELYRVGREGGSFESGIRTVVQGTITRPEFIFRFERLPEGLQAGQSFRISDLELASRLSYFLWGTGPDEVLIEVASQGQLRTPAVLEQQVRRMLADRRAESLSTNFAAQWLRLTGLAEMHPEPTIFPDFTRNLAQSMRREVELLFDSLVREDRSLLDLLTADWPGTTASRTSRGHASAVSSSPTPIALG
jgi:hypothetical protein